MAIKMRKVQTQLLIRVPDDVKAWLDQQAVLNCSTKSSEIVRSIRERIERMPPSPSTAAVQGLPPP